MSPDQLMCILPILWLVNTIILLGRAHYRDVKFRKSLKGGKL